MRGLAGSMEQQSNAKTMPADRRENKNAYKRGLKNGIPIFLGYIAVSFTLGILAHDSGMTPWQATLTSMLVNASAGQYAGFTLVAANGGYVEMALVMFVANMRYSLMSASLSQRFDNRFPFFHRLIMGFGITDEIFGVSISQPGKVNPFFFYGLMSTALPGWALGTLFGVIMGNVLPADIVSALSVGLYGMFIAIIIPPARKHKLLVGIIAVSMAASWAFSVAPILRNLSSGNRTIILTVVIAGLAAILFPVDEERLNGT